MRLQKGYHCFSPTLRCYLVLVDVTFFDYIPFFRSLSELVLIDVDSHVVPTFISCPALPLKPNLPIALCKGTHFSHNPSPHYVTLSNHHLPSWYYACLSSLSSVSILKSPGEALSHPRWRLAMIDEMYAL